MISSAANSDVVLASELRRALLVLAADFINEVRALPGVERLALLGSIVTEKARPKDIDLLVTISDACDLQRLATSARRLRGRAQSLGSGADVFLGAENGVYLGRTCPWRTCRPGVRVACDASHCGRRPFLHDDLSTVAIAAALVSEPPLELVPREVVRGELPADVADWLGQFGARAT